MWFCMWFVNRLAYNKERNKGKNRCRPKGDRKTAVFTNSNEQGGAGGDLRVSERDEIARRFFAIRDAENRNALWEFLSADWVLIPGDGLSKSWEGFCDAYRTFDPSKAPDGALVPAFLHYVHMRVKTAKRREGALLGFPVRVPVNSRLSFTRLRIDELNLADVVDEDTYADAQEGETDPNPCTTPARHETGRNGRETRRGGNRA